MAKFWDSVGDLFGNVLKGAMKSLEGIYDFHAGTVGLVGGWFDDEFEKDVREHITYDWTGNNTKFLNGVEKDSVFGDTVRNIAGGVGGMLPSVALSFIPYAGPVISTGALMMGAAGNSMESSLNEGAGYGNAFMYGVGKGVVEGATEKLGGYVLGGGTSKVGKAIAGTKFGNAVSKGVGKVAFDAASEGAEEVISDLSDPALKYVTGVDDNIGENYRKTVKGLPKTFVEGAAVGSIMQGGTSVIRSGVNAIKGRGGAKATRADNAIQNISEITKLYDGTSSKNFQYDNAVKFNLGTVSDELKRMSPEARKKYLGSIGVYKNAFDLETGALKENTMLDTHREAITANLRTFSGNLAHKPLRGGENITEGAKTAKKTVERVVGSGAAVVVTNELGAEDRAIYNPDDGVIYINNNAELTGEDVAKAVALHEVTHSTEGTKAYSKLVEQIKAIMQDKNAPASVKKILGDVNLRSVSTALGYEKDMESMSSKQAAYLVETEVNADLIGDLLSDDYFIEKLAERDVGLLQKLYHSFKNRANAKKSELGPDGIKYLKKLASKFGAAIEKRAGGVKLSQIGDEDEEKKKSQEGVVSNERASKSNDEIVTLQDVQVLRSITQDGKRKSINDFTSEDIKKAEKWALKFHKELGTKSPFFRAWFGDWRSLDATKKEGIVATVANVTTQKSAVEYVKSRVKDRTFFRGNTVNDDTGFDINIGVKIYEDTITYANREFSRDGNFKKYIDKVSILRNVRDIVKKSVLLDTAVIEHKNKNDNPNRTFMHVFYSLLEVDGEKYLVKLSVDEINSNSGAIRRAYNVDNIKISPVAVTQVYKPADTTSDIEGDNSFNYIISDLFKIVKQYDKNFNPKSASKVVNDDGTPKAVYHGTNAKFTVFDYDKTKLGKLGYGFYFTANKNFAKNYAVGDNLVEAYIDIKNPLIIEETVLTEKQIDSMLEKLSEFELKADGKNIQELKEELMSQETEISRNFLFLKIASKYQDILDNMGDVIGFDGIIDKNWDEYVVFSSNQIKSATDNIGTFDRDNPDIRYSRKRAYDPKNGQDETYEEVPGGVKVHFNDIELGNNNFEAAERARRESLDALLKDGGTTFVGLTNADLDEYVATGKTLHTRNKKQRMLENGKSPILTTESEIAEFVTKAIHGEALGEVRAFGKVDERLAQAISNVRTSLNLEGKYLEIQADAIREAYKVHSAPKEKGDIALTEEDFKNIHRHIFDFDGVLSVDTHNGKTEIHMYKKSEGGYYHILTVVSSERSSLQVTKLIGVSKEKFESKYAKKIERSTGSLRMQEASDPSTKAQHTASVLSNNSIHKSGEKSNSSDKKTQKNHYNSKKTVRELIEGAIATLDLTDEEGKAFAFVTKDAEGDVVTAFWKAINSASGGTRRKLMDNLADVLLANTVFAEKSKYEALDYLKSVMHKFDLREIQEQIEPSLKRKINARWGFKASGSEDSAIDMRSVITALNKMGVNISYVDPVQALIEINNFYDSVREYAELEKGDRLSKRLGEEDYKAKKKELVSELTRIFEENKTENELAGKLAFVIEKSQEENKKHREYRKEYKADEAMLTACLALAYQKGETMKIKDHKYTKAQQPFFDLFKKIQGTIGRLIVRGVPNHSTGKEIASLIDDWYTEDNEILKAHFQHLDEKEYKAFISTWKTELAYFKNPPTPEKELSYNEVRKLTGVIAHLNSIFKNFNKVYRRGKWEDITELGTKQFSVCSSAIEHRSRAEDILVKNNQYWNTPIVNAERWDGHDPNGEFTRHIKDLQHGELMRDYEMMKLSRRLEEIFAKDEKFFKRFISGKEKIKVGFNVDLRTNEITVAEIPLYLAAELYLTSRNKDAHITLENGGYVTRLDNEKKYTFGEPISMEQIEAMYKKFPNPLKELISFIHTWNNTEGRELKYEMDILKQGTSNLLDSPYHPEERLHSPELNSVENLFGNKTLTGHSFNKERVKGATSPLIIRNVLQKFLDHAQELFEYKYIDTTIESFTKIMNANVAAEGERWKSVKNLIETQDFYTPKKGNKNPMKYIEQLQEDVKGISRGADEANSIVGIVRGAWAVSVLGGNIKVLATQYSSTLASLGEFNLKAWVKTILSVINPVFYFRKIRDKVRGVENETYKYSKWADVRRYDQNALKAMTVREKAFNKIAEFVMTPVAFIDATITTNEFEGAKAQAKQEYGFKIGTEENLKKAGEILDELGLRTQQNHYASTRSAASRSKNELVRGFVTFKQDVMAAISNLFGAISEPRVLKKKLKNATDPKEIDALKKQLRKARIRRNKYLASIILQCAYMVLLARLFNKLYGQDDEDEMTLKDLGHDFVASFNGMMPIVSEVTSFFMDGYELDNSFYSSINNLLEATKGGYNLVSDAVQGKNVTSEDTAKAIRKIFYAAGQLTGVPAKNLYKNVKAAVGIVDEGTGRSFDALFKSPSESDAKASLREGLENDDTSLTEYGLNQMYNKYGLELADNALKREMDRLVKMDASGALPNNEYTGEKVNLSPLSFKIPENLEINGEDVELSAEDRKVFKNGLKSAEKSSAAMVKTYYYRQLGDKYKAYAIRKVFEYYDLMSRETVGAVSEERASMLYYGDAVGIDMLAVLMAYKQELNGASDAEKAKRGKSTKDLITEYLNKFNLTPVQKSLVLRALGYSDKDNDKLVKAFIERRPGLSREQRAEFLSIAKVD